MGPFFCRIGSGLEQDGDGKRGFLTTDGTDRHRWGVKEFFVEMGREQAEAFLTGLARFTGCRNESG
jgi:hypothetical protein